MTDSSLFETVLIANRGEIAGRIARTLHRLGIRSAGVYSDADAHSRHTRVVDVAVAIGPAPAGESYLRIDRIVEAARRVGAQAVHPGYGFLAENPALARACADAGLVFIGPSPEAIDAMGDKRNAKSLVADAGVATLPGTIGELTDAELTAAADEIGYPLIVKPALGGGGKGMQIVRSGAELSAALTSARRTAAAAFGNDALLLERFIERPRHIEVQIVADVHGHIVHLGERECSLQRRHQKLVEEAPASGLSNEARDVLGGQAIAAARACGYANVGTVEFIADADATDVSSAWFMEMNTRLQVEHPVTEAVWGVDLVEWQVRIAAGEELVLDQADLAPHGWAIEARLNAEEPDRGFVPSAGRLVVQRLPDDPAVRVDAGFDEGDTISTHYDSLLAKVIAFGPSRTDALRSLRAALADTTILGAQTNVGFIRDLLDHPEVREGALDTALVDRFVESREHRPAVDLAFVTAAAAALSGAPGGVDTDPWRDRSGWRLGVSAWSRHRLEPSGDGGGVEVAIRAVPGSLQGAEIAIDGGRPVRADISHGEGWVELVVEAVRARYSVWVDDDTVWVGRRGVTRAFARPQPHTAGEGSSAEGGIVRAPMPGNVVSVEVAKGETVHAGQAIVVVEAMKMEHTLRAAHDGMVADVLVTDGDQVALDQPLVVIEPIPDDSQEH